MPVALAQRTPTPQELHEKAFRRIAAVPCTIPRSILCIAYA